MAHETCALEGLTRWGQIGQGALHADRDSGYMDQRLVAKTAYGCVTVWLWKKV